MVRSLGAGGGGSGHVIRVEEGQVTWCGWRRVKSLGEGGGGSGHLARVGEGQLLKKTEALKQPRKWEDNN